jgi:HEAT repeat protein
VAIGLARFAILIGLLVAAMLDARLASAQTAPPPDLPTAIARLGDLDYRTRMNAARLIRRAPAPDAVAALTAAARTSRDEFVRYRALILLTGFADRNTPALLRTLIADRNDRIREVVYRWIEEHPDPALGAQLLQSLQTEQAEFVRPALVRALAALDSDPLVQRALLTEAGRGLDFFRIAVIEALGQRRAAWARAAIGDVARTDGPLQDDALIALGRIGDPGSLPIVTAVTSPPDVVMAAHAARCLLGDDCPARIAALTEAVTSRVARPDVIRAGTVALGTIAATSDAGLNALAALLPNAAIRDQVVINIGGAALRNPDRFLKWIAGVQEPGRAVLIDAAREAFERFEEDYAEERFFAAARAAYWGSAESSPSRDIMATLIDRLEF